jgi:small conductance mechanosensitive channel
MVIKYEYLLKRDVLAPFIISLGGLIVYLIGDKLIRRVFHIRIGKMDERKRKTIKSITLNLWKYFVIVVCALMILGEFGLDTKTIIASFGLAGAVLGFAVQDTLKDIMSGLFIIIEDQYRVGDTITVDSFKGEVVALGLKTTKIKAYTGEIKIVSNRLISTVINHSLTASMAIVDVEVSYEDDIQKVENVLQNLCDRLNKELTLTKDNVNLLGVEEIGSNGVVFRLAALTKAMKHYEVQRKIRREIILELEKNNITIPYTQVVIHNER